MSAPRARHLQALEPNDNGKRKTENGEENQPAKCCFLLLLLLFISFGIVLDIDSLAFL